MVVTTKAMTAVATMTDPGLQPPTPPRLAALRQSTGKKRGKPAHTSKVLTAGISATALFGMVAVMGWQTGTSTAEPPAPLLTPVPSTVAPLVPVPTPVSTALATPTTAAPILILVPVAVPAAQPPVQTNNGRSQSNIITKSSG